MIVVDTATGEDLHRIPVGRRVDFVAAGTTLFVQADDKQVTPHGPDGAPGAPFRLEELLSPMHSGTPVAFVDSTESHLLFLRP